MTKSCRPESFADATISSSVAVGKPFVMLSRMLPENRKLSWGNIAHPPSHFPARELIDIGAVQKDPTPRRSVQALDDFHQRCLAAAVGADNGNQFSRLDVQPDAIQDQG